jgi:hypothetical protein
MTEGRFQRWRRIHFLRAPVLGRLGYDDIRRRQRLAVLRVQSHGRGKGCLGCGGHPVSHVTMSLTQTISCLYAHEHGVSEIFRLLI